MKMIIVPEYSVQKNPDLVCQRSLMVEGKELLKVSGNVIRQHFKYLYNGLDILMFGLNVIPSTSFYL